MADRKISDLTALTAPAAGDYLPIVDISEVSAANKNKRITIEELLRGAPDGTAAAPSIGFESDPNTGIYSPGADQVAISTGGTERMRITSAGCVGIGATPSANNERLKVYRSDSNLRVVDFENDRNVSGDELVRLNLGSNCNNTSSYHLIATTGGTDRYYLYGNGTYATSSDQRLKKNIETTRDGYLEDLCNLRVVKYNWNEQDDGDPKELGLIAQELEQVFPGLVQEGPANEEGQTYKAIKSSVLPFMLLKALQESTARIEALEAEVAALKAQ